MVIWICGLSGAGKTTIGAALYKRLKPELPRLVLLDGDDLRNAMGNDLGHDPKARLANSMRIANLCDLLARQDLQVICCAVTIAPEVQTLNRARLADYREIYLRVSLDVLRQRDPKGIYRRAERGEIANVAGVDIPFIEPSQPHLVIDNDPELGDPTELIERIVAVLPPRVMEQIAAQ